MPKTGLRQTFKLKTRDSLTTVDCEIGMTIEGRELPTTAVLGEALENCVELIQAKVTDYYTKVPSRP